MKCKLYTTIFSGDTKKQIEDETVFSYDEGQEDQVVNLYPEVCYQTLKGFGGALTDASGYVYSLMNKEQQKKVVDTYFGVDGLRYKMVRIPMDSCDFSLGHYEAMSDPDDFELKSFSMERTEKYIIPLLKDAETALGKSLEILLSPWSPPAFMKTNGERNHGGKLKAEYRTLWAKYICKYIVEFQKRGYDVKRLTIQNEPKAVQTWDSCVFTAKEEGDFLQEYLVPELQRQNLQEIEVFIWDHNKERAYERAKITINEDIKNLISGVALHWYSGDHFEQLDLLRESFPDKKLILSEACIEYVKYGTDNFLSNAQKYAHDLIGNLNHGMESFYDWNILLNEQGGPNHVNNNCDAPFLYHTDTKELEERNTLAYIRHFSHYLEPGSKRIAYSKYTDKIEVTAFRTEKNEIVMVFLNSTMKDIPVNLRVHDEMVSLNICAQGIATAVIKES